MPAPLSEPVSIEQETIFNGPFSIDQLGWFGAGLLGLLFILSIRDFIFARKKWIVPVLFLFRSAACVAVLFVLAAPTKMTRRISESGHNTLAIYLDSSASMNLQDPVDGKGNITRWELATQNSNALLARVDEARTRIDVARALISDRPLAIEQMKIAHEIVSKLQSRLPYPVLTGETCEMLEQLIGSMDDGAETNDRLIEESSEISKRIGVISGKLARDEELDPNNSGGKTPSRLERAGSLLAKVEKDVLKDRDDGLVVQRQYFATEVTPLPDDWNFTPGAAEGKNTDLNAVLQQIQQKHQAGELNAAFVISDAVHNNSGAPLKLPTGLSDFPLYWVPAGGEYKLSDLTLWKASAPDSVGKDDFISIDCLVGSTGFSGKKTRLKLLQDGKELDSVEVTLPADGGDQNFRLTTRAKSAGAHRYEIELAGLPGELQVDNNRASVVVNVYTGDLQVLLVDGWPRWETRYLSNLLKRESSIKHREILFAPNPPDYFSEILSSKSKLDSYQIVVLGEVGTGFLGELEISNLENYVNEGGNLIVIAGRESMPRAYRYTDLADLLPVDPDQQRRGTAGPVKLAPTPAGSRIAALSLEDNKAENEAVWRLSSSLLSLAGLSSFNVPKPGAQVILEAKPLHGDSSNPGENSLPFLTWHRYGSGRVFYLSAPTTYHLRYRFGDRYHYRFWGQFLRWATVAEMNQGNAVIQISSDAKQYKENDTPKISVEIKDIEGSPVSGGSVQVRLAAEKAGESIHTLSAVTGKPGIYEGALPPMEHGEYRVEAVGQTIEGLLKEIDKSEGKAFLSRQAGFIVEALPNSENGDRTVDLDTARKIVSGTAGALIPPESLKTAIDILAKKNAKVTHEELDFVPLWNRWALFFLILIFLSAEWAGRKYAGLI
ncbi:MAG: hypothetical protein P1V20_13855 [Verrucomicrobiales bacterium]|nr:hypothetical protein [Verrucomicrobiales bacterium]